LRFEDGYESALNETRHGLNRFTEVKSHHALSDLKPPTLCLAEMPDGKTTKFYVGVVKWKAAVATFDSRVTIIKLKPLNLSSFSTLANDLDEKIFQTLLKQKLADGSFATVLSPKLSVAVIDALAKDPANKNSIEAAASHIPRLRRIPKRQWPAVRFKDKRAITWEEHCRIVARELNPERKAFYQLAWHLGASQSDLAHLQAEDVDWPNRIISFFRMKTRWRGCTPPQIRFGKEVEEILAVLPKTGPALPVSQYGAGGRPGKGI
jgi:integrase